jgi:hypothetical protein
MRRLALALAAIVLLLATAILGGCAGRTDGTLQFKANGEDFVRQGFVSKDGWAISFEHVLITLSDVTAYQTDPPYEAHEGGPIKSDVSVGLEGTHTVDLAEGGEDAAPILLGEMTAKQGHYNALSWRMVKAASGDARGYSLLVVGLAEKDGRQIPFTLAIDEEYGYRCGEYVGDERKGIVTAGGTADVEMTFHFDHIFGDADTPPDDDLNQTAVGFQPFADIADGIALDADLAELESRLSSGDYTMLVDILPTLGHVGEGHCSCKRG